MDAALIALCLSEQKGGPKTSTGEARFQTGHGLSGDAHAGPGHRQVSLLLAEDIRRVEAERQLEFPPGVFGENAIVTGIELATLGLGSELRLGEQVLLSVSQVGKTCHAPCAIYRRVGACLMRERGVFARVMTGGTVRVGDRVSVENPIARAAVQAVVLTLSDRAFRGTARDTAGPVVARLLESSLSAHVYRTEILPDDRPRLIERLQHYADGHSIDLVVTVGGTGFSPRDITPEAIREVVDRFTPGIDEAMRRAASEKHPHGILSRAVSGIRQSTLILSVPGSERGARENLEAVLPALAHGLEVLRNSPVDCGRAASE